MLAPTRHRFSVKEYYRMAETGVLHPDSRVELLDGEIHDMSPIGPLHGGVVNRLSRLFNLLAQGRWLVSTQNPVRLDAYSEPQPDLMLLKPAPDDYTSHHPEPDDVWLLIEVADTSLTRDRRVKAAAYARARIGEVWIVDLVGKAIEVYREPRADSYASMAVFRPGDRVFPAAVPDAAVDIAELLKQAG